MAKKKLVLRPGGPVASLKRRGRPPGSKNGLRRAELDERKMSALVLLLQLPASERDMVLGAVRAMTE